MGNTKPQPQDELPTAPDDLLAYLDDLGIHYEIHEHDPVFTVEESTHLKASIPGLHCRNLFVRDRKKVMFLIVAANETEIDLKKLESVLDCKRLSFGSAERLWQYLGVRPGSVCPFAIMNDTDGDITIVLDKSMMEADIVCYHPMENHLTIGLAPDDLVKFIESTGHKPWIMDLSRVAPDGD